MKVEKLLRKLIKEQISELARIASGYTLADDWETKLAAVDATLRDSIKTTRIIDYLKDNGSGVMKDIALEKFKTSDPAAVAPRLRELVNAGIVKNAGLVSEPKSNQEPTEPGQKGRPKVTDESKKMVGLGIVSKYSKGQNNFTAEEIAAIEELYSLIPKGEETIDEVKFDGNIKSSLEKIIQQAWAESDLNKAKKLVTDFLETSKIKDEDKKKMITTINNPTEIANKARFDRYLANALLSYEGSGLGQLSKKKD